MIRQSHLNGLLIVFVTLASAGVVWGGFSDSLSQNLIGHWPFDEGSGTTVNNMGSETACAGNPGCDGVIEGAVIWQPGRVGTNALQFNGSDTAVNIAGSELTTFGLADSDYSFAWWINHDVDGSFAGDKRMIIKESAQDTADGYSLSNPTNLHLSHHSMLGGSNQVPGLMATKDIWNHFTITYDVTENRHWLYRDGLEMAVSSPSGPLANDEDQTLRFGKVACCGQHYSGLMDDIRIYDRVLTVPEVAELAEIFNGVLGDFDNNTLVDAVDYQTLLDNFFTGATYTEGDINFDSKVNLQDFVEFRVAFENFGGNLVELRPPSGAPEPSSLILLLFGLVLLPLAGRARRV